MVRLVFCALFISILWYSGSRSGYRNFAKAAGDETMDVRRFELEVGGKRGVNRRMEMYVGQNYVRCSAFDYKPISTDLDLRIEIGSTILRGAATSLYSYSGKIGSFFQMRVNFRALDTRLACTCSKLNAEGRSDYVNLVVNPIMVQIFIDDRTAENDGVVTMFEGYKTLKCSARGLKCKPLASSYNLQMTVGGLVTPGKPGRLSQDELTVPSGLKYCWVTLEKMVNFTTNRSDEDVLCQVRQRYLFKHTFKLEIKERIENVQFFVLKVNDTSPQPDDSQLEIFEGVHAIWCAAHNFFPRTADLGMRVTVGTRKLMLHEPEITPATNLSSQDMFKATVTVSSYLKGSDENVTCTCDNLNPVKKAVSYRLAVKPVSLVLYMGGVKVENGSVVKVGEGDMQLKCEDYGLSINSPDVQLDVTVGQRVVIPASHETTRNVLKTTNTPYKRTTMNATINISRSQTAERLQCRAMGHHTTLLFVTLDVWYNTYQTHAVCPERWELGQPVTLTCQIRVQTTNDLGRGRRCDPEGNPSPTPTLLLMQRPTVTSFSSIMSPLSDVITRCVATDANVTSSVSDDDSSYCVTWLEAADDGEGVTYRANFSFVVSGNDRGWWRCGVGWPCHQGQNYSADVILDSPTYLADNCDNRTLPVDTEEPEEDDGSGITATQAVAIAVGVAAPAAAGICYAIVFLANQIMDNCQFFLCCGGGGDDVDNKESRITTDGSHTHATKTADRVTREKVTREKETKEKESKEEASTEGDAREEESKEEESV